MTGSAKLTGIGAILLMALSLPTSTASADDYGTEVRTGPARPDAEDEPGEGRPVTAVGRRQLDERQARSAPEALRWAPGVAVQQTAHGQGSPYVRGVTGRRTLLLFDGLRLNHALFRQGPNQYLFTVDPGSLAGIAIVRGAAGVELGANAVGGAILTLPAEPGLSAGQGLRGATRATYRHNTADQEHAARVQAEVQAGGDWAALFGVGGRTAGRLQSAGHVGHLAPLQERSGAGALKEVPRLQADGRTQLGTGFDVLSADARVVRRVDGDGRLTVAGYAFRQLDSPRTDQCPPPEAGDDECLLYEEQFRTHVYGKADLAPGARWADRLTAALSWQRQHERRSNDQGHIINGGRDDIDVVEARTRVRPRAWAVGDQLRLRVPYGADASAEQVSSSGWFTLPRSDVIRHDPRGQYVEGSQYQQGGAWLAPRLEIGDRLTLRAGGRWAFAAAQSPAEQESDTAAIDKVWSAVVASAGLVAKPVKGVTVQVGLDQGFRPPNLDDLTARQLTGQGRQLENPALTPERSTSVDLGVRVQRRRWYAQAWLFQTWLSDAMERQRTTCPAGDRECAAARRAPPVRLINLPGAARLTGAEADAGWRPGGGLELRGFGTWTVGEDGDGTPLSRVPPLQGGAEATWRQPGTGAYIGAGLRWSADQDRLSDGDLLDSRIPYGGTPGFAVAELRLGMRWSDHVRLRAVIDNVTNQPWRVHGAGVLGTATSATITLELTP